MKERILYFDFLRALAIVAVIAIHGNSIGYKFEDNSFNFIASTFIRQSINFGVPLFLAISGFFLATKAVNTKTLYFSFLWKQISRVLIPLIIWSSIYVAFDYSNGAKLSSLIKKAVTFQASAPFYYILLIIQFYVFLPFLQKIGSKKLGLVISLLTSLICCFVIYYLRYHTLTNLPLVVYAGNFATWIVFFVLGIYLRLNTIKINRAWLIVLCTFTFFLSLFETGFVYHLHGEIIESTTAVKASSFLYSFFVIIYLFSLKKDVNSRIMIYVGELSFGIYFLHMFVLTALKSFLAEAMPDVFKYSIFIQLLLIVVILSICTMVGLLFRMVSGKVLSKYFGF
jgi:peptidoglycan/LPS O-acetylase OafA/YrhL